MAKVTFAVENSAQKMSGSGSTVKQVLCGLVRQKGGEGSIKVPSFVILLFWVR
jgi:hypothetical protein